MIRSSILLKEHAPAAVYLLPAAAHIVHPSDSGCGFCHAADETNADETDLDETNADDTDLDETDLDEIVFKFILPCNIS